MYFWIKNILKNNHYHTLKYFVNKLKNIDWDLIKKTV
jgi:hypothetical protein